MSESTKLGPRTCLLPLRKGRLGGTARCERYRPGTDQPPLSGHSSQNKTGQRWLAKELGRLSSLLRSSRWMWMTCRTGRLQVHVVQATEA